MRATMLHRIAYLCACVLAGSLLTGCDSGAPPPPDDQTALDTASAREDLSGRWSVTFHHGDSTVAGYIALFPSTLLRDSFGLQPGAGVTQGTYDVRFEPFGFALAGDAPLHPAISELTGDSAEIVLNPSVGHGRLVMQGRYAAGAVRGAWYYDGRGGGGGAIARGDNEKARLLVDRVRRSVADAEAAP